MDIKRKSLLTLALSASLASFGAFAQDIDSGAGGAGAGTDMGAGTGAGDPGAPGAGGMPGAGAGAGAAGMGASQPFEKLDVNKDGSISKQEAKRNNINKQFSQIDTDRDDKVSQSEYQAWVQTGAGAAGGGAGESGRMPHAGEGHDTMPMSPGPMSPGQRPPRE